MSTEFKVGDRVKAFGCEGVVAHVTEEPPNKLPLCVHYENGKTRWYYPDGREEEWHKEPSLKLIARAKTKVKLYPALLEVNDGWGMSFELFKNEEEAKCEYPNSFIRLLTDDHHAVEVEEI